MTEKKNKSTFVKYRLTWKFTDEGEDHSSEFYLPWGIEPSEYVGSILSVVELSASEYGYAYDLKIVECPNFIKDEDYYDRVQSGEVLDREYVARIDQGFQRCQDCLWVEDKETCLYDEIHETDPVDMSRIHLDKMWASLRKRIRESKEPIKVTGILNILQSASESVQVVKDWANYIGKGPKHLGDV